MEKEIEKYTPKVWFISDIHAFHKNICKYTDRAKVMGLDEENPNIAMMNKWIIDMWNRTVNKHDTVYILGDFSFINTEETRKFLEKLHGKKHFIWGNHDKSVRGLEHYFESTSYIKEVVFHAKDYPFMEEDMRAILCHFPMIAWDKRMHGAVHIAGHTHGVIDKLNEESGELRVDVGLDAKLANYGMVSLETVYNYFKKIAGGKKFSDYVKEKSEKDGIRL